jgi:hypothetical protein
MFPYAQKRGAVADRGGSGWIAGALVALLLVGSGALLWSRWQPPRLSEQEIRETVHTAIQREAGASFYVTGFIEVLATTTVDDTRVLLPRMLDIRLGTTRAVVRVPGRVSYGFDAANLEPEMIQVRENEIEVRIPELAIYSAEADLARLEVQTDVGWMRFRSSAQDAQNQALRHVNESLRRQGEAHLQGSTQPRVNTAHALQTLLTPVLQSAGVHNPRLRFRIGGDLVVEPGG